MSEKTYTESEMLLAQRKAARMGAEQALVHLRVEEFSPNWPGTEKIADALFPLPKVRRPREIKDINGDIWRVNELGEFEVRAQYGAFYEPDAEYLTADFVRALADLLANPTEEVES